MEILKMDCPSKPNIGWPMETLILGGLLVSPLNLKHLQLMNHWNTYICWSMEPYWVVHENTYIGKQMGTLPFVGPRWYMETFTLICANKHLNLMANWNTYIAWPIPRLQRHIHRRKPLYTQVHRLLDSTPLQKLAEIYKHSIIKKHKQNTKNQRSIH